MAARPQLVCEGVSAGYGSRVVLEGVDLALKAGAVTAVLGPNGAGKTTLLALLAGLSRPTSGRVTWDGVDLATLPAPELARRVALVGAEPPIPFAWSALEIVLMGRAPHVAAGALERPEDLQAAREALGRVDALDLAGRRITELSAGERQRVLIARGLCQDTPVLLLDEPTSHLDPAHALRLATVLRDVARGGRAVVWVAHDVNLAARGADQLVFLKDRAVAAHGSPDALLTEDTMRRVYGIGGRRLDGDPPAFVLGDPPS